MIEAWFIRHGESVSNANLPTVHPANSEMTARGRQESKQIAQAFIERPDLIVISAYIRAQQTAEPTIVRFSDVPTTTWPVHEYTYLAAHHYNGTTGSDRRAIAMGYWERNDPHYRDGPESETFAELLERVWHVVDRLHQTPNHFVAIFSHGLFIRALLWAVLTNVQQPTPAQMQRYSHFCQAVRVPNGAICRVTIDEKGLRLNSIDTDHMGEA